MASLVLSCVFHGRRRDKKSSFETNPATNSTPGRIFTGSEPDVLLAVRAFSALDTRLLTKQGGGRLPRAPSPVSSSTTAGDVAHPEEGPPERTPGPLESPWRCSSGYPDSVGRKTPAVSRLPASHTQQVPPTPRRLQQPATGCSLKPLAHLGVQLEFNDSLMVYCIYLYVSF